MPDNERSNFQDWFQEYRHSNDKTPSLKNIQGSCFLPKRTIIDMLRDAYQAGVAATHASLTPSNN